MPTDIVPQTSAWHPSIDLGAWEEASTDPRIILADGSDIRVAIRAGHLTVTDGPRSERVRKFSRIERNLSRLVILAGHGFVTIEAQRWLNECGISWAILEDNGTVLSTSGPHTINARLIRAQSYAPSTSTGLEIARYILTTKLEGQADILDYLGHPQPATFIRSRVAKISQAPNVPLAMTFEGLAAERYWKAWEGISVPFGRNDVARIPHHWLKFTDRFSQAGDKPRNRNATDPINSMLNYIYRIAQTECLHACHALSLSPVLGIIHADRPDRDSFILDLLETVRPTCDRIILDMLLSGERLDRRLFSEMREGIVRLIPPLTHKLASHAAAIGEALAPHAYHIAHTLARDAAGIVTIPKPTTRVVKQTAYRGYPAARLRPGVRANDIVRDEFWNEVELLIPAHARMGQPWRNSSRDMLAVFLARYKLKCPWQQCLGVSSSPVHKSTAHNRWREWELSGVWAKIWTVAEKYDYWDELIQRF